MSQFSSGPSNTEPEFDHRFYQFPGCDFSECFLDYTTKSVLTRDGYCTREIKMRIAIAKEAFNRKMSLLTSKLNIKLK